MQKWQSLTRINDPFTLIGNKNLMKVDFCLFNVHFIRTRNDTLFSTTFLSPTCSLKQKAEKTVLLFQRYLFIYLSIYLSTIKNENLSLIYVASFTSILILSKSDVLNSSGLKSISVLTLA